MKTKNIICLFEAKHIYHRADKCCFSKLRACKPSRDTIMGGLHRFFWVAHGLQE